MQKAVPRYLAFINPIINHLTLNIMNARKKELREPLISTMHLSVKLEIDPVTHEPTFWQRISKRQYLSKIRRIFKDVNKQLKGIEDKYMV